MFSTGRPISIHLPGKGSAPDSTRKPEHNNVASLAQIPCENRLVRID
jgi:hypothetical protein